jgi:DNA-binding NarL/FixJ family response regulator
MSIKTLIVDDHELVLSGIRSLLGEVADIEIVGEALDGRSAIELTPQLKPDVILMDISLPGMNGVEASSRILEQSPSTKVLALSMYSDRFTVNRVLNAGVSGFVLKNCTANELVDAVRTVFNGGTYFSSEINYIIALEDRFKNRNRRFQPVSMAMHYNHRKS